MKAMDAALIGIFLKKVERFLQEEAPDEMSRIADVPVFIKEQYGLAKRAGHKTERAIVQYMLDVLTNKIP